MDHISSFKKLDDFMTRLHDCPFDFDRSSIDKLSRKWTGMFLRPLWGDPHAEHRGFSVIYVKTRLPVAEVTLTIRGGEKVEVVDDQGIGVYTFNEIDRTSNGLQLIFDRSE